ncbi:4'-phosphopantetheinyl transferase HetI [Calothrix sp. NIES-3974]|uniref:4'-phosphopantetheinyl transferase HetI n=1 Tax=Calothrix sp. NIES-3974 TaxID=2005462 RepID=UPI000B5F7E1B|nr:4'-phosphopantetheinyl transferase HetI [Calothrix sp. NIES-3974]BAZ03959.1 4'-phosphopantetheinyl transferase HetI [Calothrix sp. NIES-3974]
MQRPKLRTSTINSPSAWLPAPKEMTILPDEIHIWRIDLDQSESTLKHFATILSADELSRADRFYFQQHRQRFTAGRGILRTILSQYLNVTPGEVEFSYEEFGKPVLSEKFSDRKIWFNLSHCQGLALLAVCQNRPIGIDLEYVRPVSDVLSLAQQFFSTNEYAVMRSLSPYQKQEIFFRYWTCKEAYLKATGAGISQLQKIEVSINGNEPAKLLSVSDWSLLELVPEHNTVAAIAVPGKISSIKCWQY